MQRVLYWVRIGEVFDLPFKVNYQIVVLQCNYYNIIKWSEEKFINNYIHTVTMVTLLIWVKFHIGYMHKTKTFCTRSWPTSQGTFLERLRMINRKCHESDWKMPAGKLSTRNSWIATTWWDGHIGDQSNGKMSLKFCIIIESNSQ